MKYQDQIKQTLNTANTQTFEGILLESAFDDFVVFIPCFCVHDSPDSPCPCMHNNRILIPKGEIIGDISKIPNTSKSGKEQLSRIVVKRDAQVIFERSEAMRADAASVAARGESAGTGRGHTFSDWIQLPLPFPWPPTSTGPTMPVPDPERDPDVIYFWQRVAAAVVAGVILKILDGDDDGGSPFEKVIKGFKDMEDDFKKGLE